MRRHARRGRNAFAALGYSGFVGKRSSGVGDEIVGGRKHLNRPGDIKQLHCRVSQHVDGADWIGENRGGFGIFTGPCADRFDLSS
jgi:hypothetical protein